MKKYLSRVLRKKLISKIVGALGLSGTLLFLVVFVVFLGAVLTAAGSSASSYPETGDFIYSGLSPAVEQYRERITAYCAKYAIPDYVDLALAVMQQESGGGGLDPMQSSECPLNTQYPQTPGGITNPEYSVDCGVHYLANCLVAAKVSSPTDFPRISLALQGYNYGNGYIPWAQKRGGYTVENALEFSGMMAQRLGWAQYGDPQYVPHVLRYYSEGSIHATPDGYLTCPLAAGTYTVTSPFGPRTDPAGFHGGIDLAAKMGSPVYASEAGTVTVSCFGTPGNGWNSYGNVVVIDHGGGYATLYAHNSQLLVKPGDTVSKGQRIALVGSTGNSTGPHCHFEVRSHGERVDPTPYLQLKLSIRGTRQRSK